jgi:hypothetical protein
MPPPQTSPIEAAPGVRIVAGHCYVMFAYDIGQGVNLEHATRLVTEVTERESIRHKRRTPTYFEYRPAPMRVIQQGDPVSIAGYSTTSRVEAVVWDFGAASVTYAIPIAGPIEGLLALSDALYENKSLQEESRRRVERLVQTIASAVNRPRIADLVEDYSVYQIESAVAEGQPTTGASHGEPPSPAALVASCRQLMAQIIRSESAVLSKQEVDDALSARIAYAPTEELIIDWNAAILFSTEAEDVRAVLEYANVELLELRRLDDVLDVALDKAYDEMGRQNWRDTFRLSRGREMRRLAELQMDSAVLFEGVNNALKLIGDQYLARVYRIAADRLHLPDWDASILRKLNTVEGMYQKLHDQQANRRMETLEWIIILLIAFEVVMGFIR